MQTSHSICILIAVLAMTVLVIISICSCKKPRKHPFFGCEISRFDPAPIIPPPDQDINKEVYLINVDVTNRHARAYATKIGAVLATYSQVFQAQKDGADFHTWGWTAPDEKSILTKDPSLRWIGPNYITMPAGDSRDLYRQGTLEMLSNNPHDKYGVYVFGVKPPSGTFTKCPGRRFCIDPWNDRKWSKLSIDVVQPEMPAIIPSNYHEPVTRI